MALFARTPAVRRNFERGGIHPNDRKELTQHAPIEAFRATRVTVHLSQNIGAPSVALVAKDDLVRRGQLIASDAGGGMPIHAPISGIVLRVDKVPHPSQVVGEAIVIEAKEVPDGDMEFASTLAALARRSASKCVPPTSCTSREWFPSSTKGS